MKSSRFFRDVFPLSARAAFLFLLAVWAGDSSDALADPPQRMFEQTNIDGFGDPANSYAWSIVRFKDKIVVGTVRSLYCVERFTLDFYYPGLGALIYGDPEFPCPDDPADLDLRAEIWTKENKKPWKRVFQSPADLPNPLAPGKFVARDIGFRDMAVRDEVDENGIAQQALYVTGVSAREYTPGILPPRILRSTDGINFEPIPQDPGTFWGDIDINSLRAAAVYKNKLYVIGGPGLGGNGAIYESDDPAAGNDSFRQVSGDDIGLGAYDFAVFNGFLYVGGGDYEKGYSVWKTDASGQPPYQFTPVVSAGAGRGPDITAAVSMKVFQNRLYVGANVFGRFPLATELIRINPDDSWDLVVGNPRQTDAGYKSPISGLPDGFGNPFNIHFWRMGVQDDVLLLSTNDGSMYYRADPFLDPLIKHEYGFDLFATTDGVEWSQISRNGFGDLYNFGGRVIQPSPWEVYVGTTNHATGAEVWGVKKVKWPKGTRHLKAEEGDGFWSLSWEDIRADVVYRVWRIDHIPREELGGPLLPDPTCPGPSSALSTASWVACVVLDPDAWVPGPATMLAETRDAFYDDTTAQPDWRYSYWVETVDKKGRVSAPSNFVLVGP